MSSNSSKRDIGDKGFILVVVIWFAGLLAVIAATYAYAVRTHVRIASNVTESVRAQMLADGGTMLAVRDLLSSAKTPGWRRRFAIDGRSVVCSIAGEGRLTIEVRDEAAKVDINKAGLPLIESLLMGLGEPPEVASAVAGAILDYRDRDSVRRLNGAEQTDYIAAGLTWGPKNAPFEALDELGQVLQMTSALALRLRSHVTVHSGYAGVDPRVASDELVGLIRRGMESSSASFGTFPEPSRLSSLPAMFTSVSRQRRFGVRVVAVSLSGARFVREAVVDLGPRRVPNSTFRIWRRGALAADFDRQNASATQLPPC